MNECIPKYEPGEDLTGKVQQVGGVLGKRFLALVADKQGPETGPTNQGTDDTTGGNVVVGYPAAGGMVFGVNYSDADNGALTTVIRGRGEVVPVHAAAALAFFQEVQVDATGSVIPKAAGVAVGRTIRSAASGSDALVELY